MPLRLYNCYDAAHPKPNGASQIPVGPASGGVAGGQNQPSGVAAQMPSLIKALDSPTPQQRSGAATEIGRTQLADEAALRALVKATGDVDGDVRLAAAKAIGEIGPKAAAVSTVVPAVIEQLEAAEKAAVLEGPGLDQALAQDTVSSCISTLGVLGKESEVAVGALITVVRGARAGPTKPLAQAPKKPGTRPPGDPIVDWAQAQADSDRDFLADGWRVEACTALGDAGRNAKSSVPVLLDVLNMAAKDLERASDPRSPCFIYSAAAAALGKIGDERALPTLSWYQQGNGLQGDEDSVSRARIAADTAVREIEQAKPKRSKPKE